MFWDEVEDLSNDLINLSKILCKYKSAIMIGAEIDPEAEPLVDGVLEAVCAIAEIDNLYECGKDVYE